MKCQQDIRFVSSTTCWDHEGITLIQRPNETMNSVGFVAIGIEKEQQSSCNEFTTLDSGTVARNAFLCIVQGVFLSSNGELRYVYHRRCAHCLYSLRNTTTTTKHFAKLNFKTILQSVLILQYHSYT